MGSQIASKNLYDLLGNDPELDPDREPEPPTKAIDKPVARAGKRNAGAEGPARDAPRPAAGGRGGRDQVNTRADMAGSQNNRAEQRDDGLRQDRHPDRLRGPREHRDIEGGRGGRGGGRGGRGGRGRGEYRGTRTARDDRANHSGIGEHEKQAAHGWGAETGAGEWADEQAGAAIAEAEVKEEPGFTPDTGAGDPAFSNGPEGVTSQEDAAPAEPEDNTKSYDQYLADLAEKRMALGGSTLEARKANEGSKQKFPEGKAFSRNPESENFIPAAAGKPKKQKEARENNALVLEGQYYAPVEQPGGRGGRGGRGGGFRGDRGGDRGDRGGRGDFGGRGRGRGRGDRGDFSGRGGYRGDRGGDRNDRPQRGGGGGGFNPSDEKNFPSLGGA